MTLVRRRQRCYNIHRQTAKPFAAARRLQTKKPADCAYCATA
ncbi:hypothetical protein ANACOL_00491 [Anaerotruncus colihominis DSM 17241]|uniref:Uncharacterized protein n=1 Tax=Anaerotruncus colihominis DSM 17241 TaxID=445972 RepID=B0P6W3_9FIRM|nr:hypothetical protein ANACOL_00491 [Anaerotruncus colihominis DSM 17241]